MFKLIFLILITESVFCYSQKSLVTEYQWKYIDFDWPTPEIKQQFIDNGDYDFTKIVPIDVDREPSPNNNGRTFVTLIRTKGVPATVNVISKKYTESGPLLSPYPNWKWYDKNLKCEGIINVYRVAIDKCGQLWILDTGNIDSNNICPAKLLTFDLGTNKLVQKIIIPNNIAQNKTGSGLLITPVVYYEDNDYHCQNPTVFIADVVGNGLIVMSNKKFWRLEGSIFQPTVKDSNFNISGETFFLDDGLFGLALSPKLADNSQYLAFRPLASRSLYFAKIDDILSTQYYKPLKYISANDILPSQASAMVFSSDGTLFFHLTAETATGCWNSKKHLTSENIGIAVQNLEKLQFSSGLKLINHYKKEALITLSNRFQKIMAGTQNFNEINFRILRISVQDAKLDTVCDSL